MEARRKNLRLDNSGLRVKTCAEWKKSRRKINLSKTITNLPHT